MRNILPVKAFESPKTVARLLEWHPVFVKVDNSLGDIPIEHICVYTLIIACQANITVCAKRKRFAISDLKSQI